MNHKEVKVNQPLIINKK